MFRKKNKIHFVGIGGIGMSGIAEVLLNLDYHVSGSDIRQSATTARLESLGARIYYGHAHSNITDAHVVVTSSAVSKENPEVAEARRKRIPVISRAEMLAELMRMKHGVLIAGAHGKTTTTSLVATVLTDAGLDPTVVIGGRLNKIKSNAKLGQGDLIVAEADESDGSFMHLPPVLSVVTNIDKEHMDHYGSMENLKNTFLKFINKTPFFGVSFVCLDDEHIQDILPRIERSHVTYGLNTNADIFAHHIRRTNGCQRFDVNYNGRELGEFRLCLPGVHNVVNSLPVIGIALEFEVPVDTIRHSLEHFAGVHRRFEITGHMNGFAVVDDYGHHPTEIMAVLKAAREWYSGKVIAIFQPHRYSRVRELYEDFTKSFYDADEVIVADIYPAGEAPIPGLNSQKIAQEIKARGHKQVTHMAGFDEIVAYLKAQHCEDGAIITLGAGNVNTICSLLVTP
ncbi:UDP-N-acetylmuramate--L-alanine ligase [Desulfurispirillum indicum]|uniref:UDP-N-acetylmuramate--L-alanine ligase n=1 Tax=Desulfurispirillum indicum (strain ATCC BAA-1389 / DSM 22839 / S5) TaxID=653733 RepID=E6W1E3_DESIS|nr:UDP-N-acetylmuramate--L-alanine ligase [Desulfurispirillum indicum]ADU65399.1 UDP-N-acetylmuramate/alanine ligase [Desulfurispirillum indicum S5]UCZ57292.1 UDP-N-acetylmuramate--L-alanine ligase [Desulfurispirillum indicum]